MKKRITSAGYAVGPKILCEVRFEAGLKSTEANGRSAVSMRESRLRWHGSAWEDRRGDGKISPGGLESRTLRSIYVRTKGVKGSYDPSRF